MYVMPARMHYTRVLGFKWDFSFFRERKRIHIGADSHTVLPIAAIDDCAYAVTCDS